MGKNVFNDKSEKVGVVDDLIIAPDKAVSYAIIGTGGLSDGQARCGHSR